MINSILILAVLINGPGSNRWLAGKWRNKACEKPTTDHLIFSESIAESVDDVSARASVVKATETQKGEGESKKAEKNDTNIAEKSKAKEDKFFRSACPCDFHQVPLDLGQQKQNKTKKKTGVRDDLFVSFSDCRRSF